jgi:hypothetical protein
MRRRWRVQATWTVDGEERSYAPQFARTRLGANRLRRDLERTLSHFPTLTVLVESVSAEAAAEESARRTAAQPQILHRIEAPSSTMTVCGLERAAVGAVAVEEVFRESSSQCPDCAGRS